MRDPPDVVAALAVVIASCGPAPAPDDASASDATNRDIAPVPVPRIDAGSCPAPEYASCAGVCTHVAVDYYNCGACDHACMSGQTCASGTCQGAGCPGSMVSCDGGCIDVTADPRNCGACGNVCPDGQRCVASVCR